MPSCRMKGTISCRRRPGLCRLIDRSLELTKTMTSVRGQFVNLKRRMRLIEVSVRMLALCVDFPDSEVFEASTVACRDRWRFVRQTCI
jgi:hypothetical protein